MQASNLGGRAGSERVRMRLAGEAGNGSREGGVASDLSAKRFLKLSLDSFQEFEYQSLRVVGRRDDYSSTRK